MDYATTLEVVRRAEGFHEAFDQARRNARFDGLASARKEACEGLTPEAIALFRALTTLAVLTARPDLSEHFLDGNLSNCR
ncbi:hypothetical protein [Cryptosporangium sp. NPDC051539]|uniref:hypothetical protein n=1 Tax=Cryptosporangium sp. NPDC051539 TaxID=3363962 RepID=UPI00379F7734